MCSLVTYWYWCGVCACVCECVCVCERERECSVCMSQFGVSPCLWLFLYLPDSSWYVMCVYMCVCVVCVVCVNRNMVCQPVCACLCICQIELDMVCVCACGMYVNRDMVCHPVSCCICIRVSVRCYFTKELTLSSLGFSCSWLCFLPSSWLNMKRCSH